MAYTDLQAVRELEGLSFRTWPAREVGAIGNWAVGATDGFTRRANSAQALGDPGLSPQEAIREVEAWYAARGIVPCIKITPASPDWLDPSLAASGWSKETPATVMSIDLTKNDIPSLDQHLCVSRQAAPGWLALSALWEGRATGSTPLHRALLARIPSAGIATSEKAGNVIGLGVCALEGEEAFLYDLVIHPEQRNQGHGRHLTQALLAWAHAQAATRAILQVLDTNRIAHRLYVSLGFVPHHTYHYRQAPGSCGSSGC